MYNVAFPGGGGTGIYIYEPLFSVGPAPANQAVSTPKPKTPPLPLLSLPEHTEPVALVDK